MSIAENKAIAERWVDAHNAGDFAAWDEICAPSFVMHTIGDLQQTKEFSARLRKESPDLHIAIEEMLAEGDKVAFRWTLRRTLEGAQIYSFGISIVRIVDGKIVDYRYHSTGQSEARVLEWEAMRP